MTHKKKEKGEKKKYTSEKDTAVSKKSNGETLRIWKRQSGGWRGRGVVEEADDRLMINEDNEFPNLQEREQARLMDDNSNMTFFPPKGLFIDSFFARFNLNERRWKNNLTVTMKGTVISVSPLGSAS